MLMKHKTLYNNKCLVLLQTRGVFPDLWSEDALGLKVFFLGFKKRTYYFSLNNFSRFLNFSWSYNSVVLLLADITSGAYWQVFYLREDNLICIVKIMLLWNLLGKLLHFRSAATLFTENYPSGSLRGSARFLSVLSLRHNLTKDNNKLSIIDHKFIVFEEYLYL